MRTKSLPGLNIKVPRLGINRHGVYYVRASILTPEGARKVVQKSLYTKDANNAKLLALKFCLNLVETQLMSEVQLQAIRYEIDPTTGAVKANGEDDHLRAMEALAMVQKFHIERLQLMGSAGLPQSQQSQIPAGLTSLIQAAAAENVRQALGKTVSAPQPAVADHLLKKLLEQHLHEESLTLKSQRTVLEKKALFKEFLEFFGEDTGVNQITLTEITGRWRPYELSRKSQKNPKETISPGRKEKRRTYLAKFFEWAKNAGYYIHPQPMGQKMATKKEIQQKTRSYKEFTSEDLTKLFSDQYKEFMNKPDWYWLPVIALFSGARQGELANLTVESFEEIDTIKCFYIADGKTLESRRTVPIHSVLLDLGLWEYVQNLKNMGIRQFVPHRPANDRTKSVSRQWGLWVQEVEIDDPSKVFHSFRSTAITELYNNSEVNPAAIRSSVGHSGGMKGSHAGYVRGVELQYLKNSIERIAYPSVNVQALKLADPTFKRFLDEWAKKASSAERQAKLLSRQKHLLAKAERETRTQGKGGNK